MQDVLVAMGTGAENSSLPIDIAKQDFLSLFLQVKLEDMQKAKLRP